jgi:hypothetical protein
MDKRPASETADLEAALRFVIGRIEEEANRSGKPLSDEERSLLNNLPKDLPLFQNSGAYEEFPPVVVPRDATYEKLCALAKSAHHSDRTVNAEPGRWEFAVAVSTLCRHPISWLLWWAGVKTRKPARDPWLLLGAAALILICFGAALITPIVHQLWTRLLLTLIAAGCIAIVVLLYFASQRTERWQLEQSIERYRRG